MVSSERYSWSLATSTSFLRFAFAPGSHTTGLAQARCALNKKAARACSDLKKDLAVRTLRKTEDFGFTILRGLKVGGWMRANCVEQLCHPEDFVSIFYRVVVGQSTQSLRFRVIRIAPQASRGAPYTHARRCLRGGPRCVGLPRIRHDRIRTGFVIHTFHQSPPDRHRRGAPICVHARP